MSKILCPLVSLLFAATCLIPCAAAADLPSQIQAGEHRLVLNGSGARTKTLLQLYVAGLYLTESTAEPAKIIAADEPMAIRIKITSGFVSRSNLVESLEEGFKASTGGNTSRIRAEIDKFRECFQGDIAKNDIIDLLYLPTHGVIVNKNSKVQGVVPGIEFKQALFGVWLSNSPADKTLKQALLSGSTRR